MKEESFGKDLYELIFYEEKIFGEYDFYKNNEYLRVINNDLKELVMRIHIDAQILEYVFMRTSLKCDGMKHEYSDKTQSEESDYFDDSESSGSEIKFKNEVPK